MQTKYLGDKLKKYILLLALPFLLTANEGERIYKETCVSCHGVDGNTNPDMQLVVKPRKLTKTILTPEESFKIIKEGAHAWGAHSDIMPAFKYVYSDEQIKSVAEYISTTFNPDRDSKVQ